MPNSPKLFKGTPRIIRKDLIKFNATPQLISSGDISLVENEENGSKPLSLQDILKE
jgi:hypothetical protein